MGSRRSVGVLCHGLSNLLIDGVFDGMPMQLPDAATLARQLTERALDGEVGV